LKGLIQSVKQLGMVHAFVIMIDIGAEHEVVLASGECGVQLTDGTFCTTLATPDENNAGR
jgi:hypothetical protein